MSWSDADYASEPQPKAHQTTLRAYITGRHAPAYSPDYPAIILS